MSELIFVVENQFEVCRYAKQTLEEVGYRVSIFSTCQILPQVLADRPPLILLSLQLADSRKLYRRVKSNPKLAETTAIIFLVEGESEDPRIQATESSAEAYIVKPLRSDEMLASVRAALHQNTPSSQAIVSDKPDLVIDNWAMKLQVRGTEVQPTVLEFRLIDYLARHRGQVFDRNALLDAIWGEMRFVTPRSVDACVRRIRSKIESNHTKPSLLNTVRGVGYRLDASAVWEPAPHQNCDCVVCSTRGRTDLMYVNHLTRKVRRPPARGQSDSQPSVSMDNEQRTRNDYGFPGSNSRGNQSDVASEDFPISNVFADRKS